MPRAPRLCNQRDCRQPVATGWSQCETHKPAPFEGAKQRWNSARPQGWDALRRAVIKLHMGTCALCASPGSQIDHITPVAEGGSWSIENLQLLCQQHHNEKSKEDARRARARRRGK